MNGRLVTYAGAAAAGALVAGSFAQRRDFLLPGRVVLVTGGSRGLGLVIARELVACGARVAICARDADELDRARDDLVRRGGEVLAVPCDITDPVQIDQLVARVRDQLGPIDMLVNNAGVIQVGPMKLMTIGDYEEAMATHFWGPLHLMLAILPGMLERGEGRIVNITSIGGKIAVPHLLPYSASKFAAVGFSEGLHAELRGKGVHVLTICPGLMRTGSHLNALFAGNAASEYRWFSVGATTPGLAASASHAARRIVRGLLSRETELFITPQAAVAGRLAQVAPEITAVAMSLMNRVLPDPGAQRPMPGSQAREREPSSVRVLGRAPARRYNETGDAPAH